MERWREIAEDLERRIESGELARKTLLSTEKLEKEYKAARNTVRQAIAHLADKRVLDPRQGQGTYILEELETFVTTLSTDPNSDLGEGGEESVTYPDDIVEQSARKGPSEPTAETVKCPAKICPLLKLSENDFVVKRRQLRSIDGTIWTVQESYYPWKWVTMGAEKLQYPEDIDGGTVAYLAKTIQVQQVGYRDVIIARLPTDEEQSLFKLKRNHTVMEAYRTSFSADGEPIRVTVTAFPGDRNQLSYEMGAMPDDIWRNPIRS